jgi:hypothetical protein
MYITKSGKVVMYNNDGYDYTEVFNSDRNWEDKSGMYLNYCKNCEKHFFGNKYRIICKKCSNGKI